MMIDHNALVDQVRRDRLLEINANAAQRPELEERHGQVWDTDQLAQEFDVNCYASPFVVVNRKSDGQLGTLEFQHHPRFYFNWQPD